MNEALAAIKVQKARPTMRKKSVIEKAEQQKQVPDATSRW